MDQMIDNFKESDKEIAKITVLNYIKEAYENDFSDTKINEIFDSIYSSNKTIQELKKDTLKKLNSKFRKRRQMKNSSNKLIEDGLLLKVKESVGDPNNPNKKRQKYLSFKVKFRLQLIKHKKYIKFFI